MTFFDAKFAGRIPLETEGAFVFDSGRVATHFFASTSPFTPWNITLRDL